jgi:muramoyltetrapeptide carboxypeptidase
VFAELDDAARAKTYLGYSDVGSLLSRLYAEGVGTVAHGPMPADLKRSDGETAIIRALNFLVAHDPTTLEPAARDGGKTAAFNLTILAHLLATPWAPDLADHVVMVEDVSEYMYRIDRAFFTITSSPNVRKAKGIRLGRVSDVLENETADFVFSEEEIAKTWCERSGIPYLGRADIGHDAANKVVVFGERGGA